MRRVQKKRQKVKKNRPEEDFGPVRRDKRTTNQLRAHVLEEIDELSEMLRGVEEEEEKGP